LDFGFCLNKATFVEVANFSKSCASDFDSGYPSVTQTVDSSKATLWHIKRSA